MPRMITVSGTFLKSDGTPEAGHLEFYSKTYVLESEGNTALVPSMTRATLDSLGRVSVALPATDDPAWTPNNWTYTMVLKLSGDYSSRDVVIPYDSPNNILSVSKLVPVTVGPVVSGPHTHTAADIVSGIISMTRLPVGLTHNHVAFGDHTHDFAPSVHTHNGYAPITHNHNIADVLNLTATLDGKANTAHGHTVADVTGLQAALNTKLEAGDYPTTAEMEAGDAAVALIAEQAYDTAVEASEALDLKADVAALNAKADATELANYLPKINPTVTDSTFTVRKGDGTSGFRFRSTGGAVDMDYTTDLVVSKFANVDFSGGQTQVLRFRGGGVSLSGSLEVGDSVYANKQSIDGVNGVASLGGKNGLGVLRFAGYKDTPGAPTTGAWAVGDLVLDSNKMWWRCSAAGTPGTWA